MKKITLRNQCLFFCFALLPFTRVFGQVQLYGALAGSAFTLHYNGNMNRCEKGQSITFLSNGTIPAGGVTISINGLTAQAIHNSAGANLAAGDIQSGQEVTIVYDGAEFQMTSVSGNVIAGSGIGGGGTVNYVPKWTAAATLGSSLIFDNGVGVGIGTSSPSYTLEVAGRLKTNGVNETSDARFKTDVKTIEHALYKVVHLRGVNFMWDVKKFPDRNFERRQQMGLIAQEVEGVVPEVVLTDKEGYKSIEYSKLIGLLIEAIKEQQGRIEKLEGENATEKAQVADLKNAMDVLLKLNEASAK